MLSAVSFYPNANPRNPCHPCQENKSRLKTANTHKLCSDMSDIVKFENVQDRVIELRGQKVLLDADVAQIYGVETRDINKAVGNNPGKFPPGYVVVLSRAEKRELVENFHRFNRLKHSTVNPKAFPEKGLYMLATILKSPQAVQATLAIIETFSKIRELSRNVTTLSDIKDKNEQHDR